jgi:hypothetical protein
MRILELEEERIATIHAHHFSPKPRALNTSRMKGHDTESKALARSILRKIEVAFLWWRDRIALWTSMKLSKIDLPRMNAL